MVTLCRHVGLIHGLTGIGKRGGDRVVGQSLDPDGDGLDNRMEFLLGGEPFTRHDGVVRDGVNGSSQRSHF